MCNMADIYFWYYCVVARFPYLVLIYNYRTTAVGHCGNWFFLVCFVVNTFKQKNLQQVTNNLK